MSKKKKIFFASDLHLGLPDYESSLKREKLFVKWLDEITTEAEEIYLLGDIFDFWFEYRYTIPKGFVRFLGKITEITDAGIPVHFFTGNHDMWIFDYLPRETGMILHRKPLEKTIMGKTFFLAHGDGLGSGDIWYKMLKKIFASSFSQWLFARIHPNLGIRVANGWSHNNRYSRETPNFQGEDKEWLVLYAREYLKKQHKDYFVFGHRHLPMNVEINGSSIINLGDWLTHFSYGVFDGKNFELKTFS